MTDGSQEYLVYVGTYTTGESEGIYVYRLELSTGVLRLSSVTRVDNPSFLVIDAPGSYLYAVNELDGKTGGYVSAFSIDPASGDLTFLNRQPTQGDWPCYVSIDGTGRYVFVANYGGGSVAIFPVQAEGTLGPATDFIQHEGSSVNPQRQEGPHAHSILPDPDNRFAFACDLGLDKIMICRLDPQQGKLTPNETPWVQVKAGAGPRHFTFHPNGRFAYVINELDSTITAFRYAGLGGALTELQTVPALSQDFKGDNTCADIHVHPSGRFLYGSNRGDDSIVIYRVDDNTGELTYTGHQSTRGRAPRNFAIHPAGTLLLAGNQDSNTIVTFWIDQETGRLEPTGHVTEVPNPVCIQVIPAVKA